MISRTRVFITYPQSPVAKEQESRWAPPSRQPPDLLRPARSALSSRHFRLHPIPSPAHHPSYTFYSGNFGTWASMSPVAWTDKENKSTSR
eukprot:846821-Amorphochlora_amoeboformis.AAC.1